ncbi:unnamed protein product, partial [Fusarium graminearum]
CLLAPTLRLDLRLSLGSSALIGHPISSAQRQSQSQTRQTPDAAPASGWIIFYFSNTAPGLFVPVLHHFTLRLPYLTCQTIATQLQASPPFCLTQLGQIRFLLSSSAPLFSSISTDVSILPSYFFAVNLGRLASGVASQRFSPLAF